MHIDDKNYENTLRSCLYSTKCPHTIQHCLNETLSNLKACSLFYFYLLFVFFFDYFFLLALKKNEKHNRKDQRKENGMTLFNGCGMNETGKIYTYDLGKCEWWFFSFIRWDCNLFQNWHDATQYLREMEKVKMIEKDIKKLLRTKWSLNFC